MKKFVLNGAASLWLVAAIIAMAFTVCNRGSNAATQTDFNIYSIWRYVSSANVEHGGTWVNDGEKSIAIFKDGEYAVVISGSYAWRGILHDIGDYSYTFNAVARLDYETGIVSNVEGQGPYTFVLKYDPQTRRLISADGTVEEYYEWFSESGFVPDIGFSNTHQEILTADISEFVGTWVTVHVHKMQIKANGRLQLIDNNLFYFSDDYETDVYIFPAGVEFVHWSGTVKTDTTKDRVFIQGGSERIPTNDDVYYREGETAAQSGNDTADELQQMRLGERVWQFQSGDLINFFKHYKELIIIDFRNDGNVYVTDQNIDRSSFTVSGRWHITGGGKLEIRPNTEGLSAMRSELNFSYKISGNLLTITDDEGFTATYYEIFPYG